MTTYFSFFSSYNVHFFNIVERSLDLKEYMQKNKSATPVSQFPVLSLVSYLFF